MNLTEERNKLFEKLLVFKNIRFNASKHTYVVADTFFKSATSFLKDYKQPFMGSPSKQSRELGIPEELVRERWSLKGSHSLLKGNELHHYIECNIMHEKMYTPYTDINHQINQFNNFKKDISKRCLLLDCEVRVADFDNNICGTIDCIGVDVTDGKYVLFDWKSNAEIAMKGFNNAKKKSLLKHLDDSAFIDYSLQLSFYWDMLEKSGVPVKGAFIVHFPPEGTYNMFQIRDLREDINKLF